MNNIFYIYGLYSTEDRIIKYIGYTSDLEKRLIEHKKDVNRSKIKTYKKNWINKCIKKGFDIDLLIIDISDNKLQVCEMERYYINNYLLNNKVLVNGTLGGDGGIMTEESKLKLSISSNGKKLSEVTKQKIREAKLGNVVSIETKKKMSDTHKRIGTKIIFTDEVRLKMSKNKIGKPGNRLGSKASEDTKLKISNSKKGTISKKRKPVLQIDPKTKKIINTFDAITIAQQITGINNIYRCILKLRKTAGNYEWKFKL